MVICITILLIAVHIYRIKPIIVFELIQSTVIINGLLDIFG